MSSSVAPTRSIPRSRSSTNPSAQVPTLGEWSYGTVTADLRAEISGGDTAEHALVPALPVAVAWCVVILAPGWLRLLRGDLK